MKAQQRSQQIQRAKARGDFEVKKQPVVEPEKEELAVAEEGAPEVEPDTPEVFSGVLQQDEIEPGEKEMTVNVGRELVVGTVVESVPEARAPEEVDSNAPEVDEQKAVELVGGETEISEELRRAARVQTDARVEEEIPLPPAGRKRHKVMPWIWWGVGLVCALLVYLGGVWLKNTFEMSGKNDNHGVVSEQPSEESEKPTEETEPEPSEEPEVLPEEPEPEPAKPVQPEQPPVVPEEPVVYPGNAGGPKMVALTFDDGPSAATTPRLLDILQGRGVKATFFVLGTMARRAPDLVRREVAEGHEVASHTPYHNQLTNLTFGQVQAEAAEMNGIFQEILGVNTPFTRPPYGAYNANVSAALAQPLVLWSVDPRDWQDRNASTVCSRVLAATRNGSIILVHDIHATTVDAVPCIVDNLRAQGYEFATVSQLAASRGITMVSGGVYYSF